MNHDLIDGRSFREIRVVRLFPVTFAVCQLSLCSLVSVCIAAAPQFTTVLDGEHAMVSLVKCQEHFSSRAALELVCNDLFVVQTRRDDWPL